MVRGISIAPTLHLTKPRNHVQGNKEATGAISHSSSSSRPESKTSENGYRQGPEIAESVKSDTSQPDKLEILRRDFKEIIEINKSEINKSQINKSEINRSENKPEILINDPEIVKPEIKPKPTANKQKPELKNSTTDKNPVDKTLVDKTPVNKSIRIEKLLKELLNEVGITSETCTSFELDYKITDGTSKTYSSKTESPKTESLKSEITSTGVNKINMLNLTKQKNLGKSIMLAPNLKSDSRNGTPLPEKNPKICNIESMYRQFDMELPQVGNVQYQSDSSIIQVTWRQERGFEYNIKSDVYEKS